MNATLQAMRAIPELQTALEKYAYLVHVTFDSLADRGYTRSDPNGLAHSLRRLYTDMTKTTDEVTPGSFLQSLRQAFPQFAEMARGPGGMKGMYAQQGMLSCRSDLFECHKLNTVLCRCGGMLGAACQLVAQRAWTSRLLNGLEFIHEDLRGAVYVRRDTTRVSDIRRFCVKLSLDLRSQAEMRRPGRERRAPVSHVRESVEDRVQYQYNDKLHAYWHRGCGLPLCLTEYERLMYTRH